MKQILLFLLRKLGNEQPAGSSLGHLRNMAETLFTKVSLGKQRMLPSLELSYEPDFGFRINVQRVHNLPS